MELTGAILKKCDQAAIGVEKLLTSLWHSEFQFRLNYYRVGIALLADVGMEFGMTERCRKILDEIMPQVRSFMLPWQEDAQTWFTDHRRDRS